MKNITLSADEQLIEAARARARERHTTLNELFRRWLEELASPEETAKRAMATIRRLQSTVDTAGQKFTREEMNER